MKVSSLRLALQGAVTAASLCVLLHAIPFQAIGGALAGADWNWVAAALLAQAGTRAAAALRMGVIADVLRLGLSSRAVWKTLMATSFYSVLLPGGLGGGATWLRLVQQGAPKRPALAAVLLNRLADVAGVAVLGLCFWIAERRPQERPGIAAALGLACVLVVCAAPRLAPPRRLPRRAIAALLATSVAQNLLGAASMTLFARALGLELGFVTVGWIRAAIALLAVIPISIANLGVREGALVVLSAPYGVSAGAAVAWSLAIFGGTLCAALCGGALELRALWSSPARGLREAPRRESVS